MKTVCISTLAIDFLMLGSAVAPGQPATARDLIAHVEGVAFLDGQRLQPQAADLPLKQTSVVRTEDGRAEIRLAAGDIVFLGENASVRLSSNRGLNSSRFEMLTGSAVVITGGLGPVVICEEDVHLSDSGIFRFDVHPVAAQRFCRVRVYKGAAAAQLPSFLWVLATGKMVDLNRGCGDHTPRNNFNIEDIDGLDRWSRQRFASNAGHQ